MVELEKILKDDKYQAARDPLHEAERVETEYNQFIELCRNLNSKDDEVTKSYLEVITSAAANNDETTLDANEKVDPDFISGITARQRVKIYNMRRQVRDLLASGLASQSRMAYEMLNKGIEEVSGELYDPFMEVKVKRIAKLTDLDTRDVYELIAQYSELRKKQAAEQKTQEETESQLPALVPDEILEEAA